MCETKGDTPLCTTVVDRQRNRLFKLYNDMATKSIADTPVKINKKCHTLVLNNENILLDCYLEQANTIEDVTTKSIAVNDIIVCKKSEKEPKMFELHYIQKLDLMHLGAEQMVIACESENVRDHWVVTISEILNKAKHRPRRLLVFINPDSGNNKAVKIYESKVAPYLLLAGIQTDVIVTQRGGQSNELLQSYDLTNIDGVLAVGGDGTVSDVINGLVDRVLADHDLDPNNSNITIPQIPVRVGIIPAGSGDGYSLFTAGHKEPTTSALRIIRGEEILTDVCSIHQGEKFIKWTFLMAGYGAITDPMYWSEGWLRWLGPTRYIYAVLRSLCLHRSFDAEIEYLPANNNTDKFRTSNVSLKQDINAWQRITGAFSGFCVFPGGLTLPEPAGEDSRPQHERHNESLGGGYHGMLLLHQTSRWNTFKFMKGLFTKSKEIWNWDTVKVADVKELKIKFHSHIPFLQNFFMSDGEINWLDIPPSCEIRTHQQVLRLFSSGVLIPIDQLPSM